MTYKIIEWDSVAKGQIERDATPSEIAEIEARQQAASKPDVPQSVTMLQARLALQAAELLEQANATIAALPGKDGESARTYWEFANNVLRDNPLVALLAANLSLTDAQIDQLFMTASQF